MQVSDITVEFMRRVQLREYEPAEARVTLKASLVDGEDHNDALMSLMADAKSAAIATLKGKAGETTQTVKAPVAAAPVQKTTTPVKPAEAKTAAAAPAAEAPKNKGGRPRKDAVKPAEAKVEKDEFGDPIVPAKAAAVAAPADGVDEFGDPVSAAAATPDDDEFAENEVKPMSPIELQQIFSGLVMEKKVAGSDIKAIMLKYGAARTADTQEKDRAAILAEVKALIKK